MAYLAFAIAPRAGHDGRATHAGDLLEIVDVVRRFGRDDGRLFLWIRCDDIPSVAIRRALKAEEHGNARRRRFRLDPAALVVAGVASAQWLAAALDGAVTLAVADTPTIAWADLLSCMRDKDRAPVRAPVIDRIEEHWWDVEKARLTREVNSLGALVAASAEARAERDAVEGLRVAAKSRADQAEAAAPLGRPS